MICYIVGALECELDFTPTEKDLVIAADKGYENLLKSNKRVDLLLGDFDSLDAKLPEIPTVRHPIVKDDTDTALAIEYAINKGYNRFVIYGCIGGRTDHTFANLQLLHKYAEMGLEMIFVDNENCITAIKNSVLNFKKEAMGTVSVFSLTEVSRGVSIKGLFYELSDHTLSSSNPLGVSNEFVGQESEISVKDGILMIITNCKNLLDR